MNKNNYFVIFLKKINLSVNSLIKKYLNKLKTSNKNNYFVIFVKKINLSVNSLIKKYSKKLNISNLSNILLNNKVFLTFIGLIVLFFLYLLIPHTYSKTEIRKELENQLLNKYNLDFNFSKNFLKTSSLLKIFMRIELWNSIGILRSNYLNPKPQYLTYTYD